jgi:UDP:flavonoid glycosyltransferase YjiC (YdhE family)
MITKKKVLFFPFDLLAHYLRCLVLAEQYKEDYEVYFLHSDAYKGFVEQHGFKTFRASTFDSAHVMACAANFDFSWLEYSVIEDVFLAQVLAIEELKPELVIGDVAPTLKMAAAYTDVNYVALMNGYMTPYYAEPRKISRTHPASHLLERIPPQMAARFTSYGEKLSFYKIHSPFKRLRKKYKLKSVFSYLWETQGDENLICDLPELFPQRNLPDNYRIIKPLIYQNNPAETAMLLAKIDHTKQTICVCFGSTGNWEALAFLNDPYYQQYNIITAGDVKHILSGSHILRGTFLNLPAALEQTDLLICHGGNGTVNCGIEANVYMLCLTAHFEQEWNVHALEKHGYGKSADNFNPDDWKREITSAVSHRIYQSYGS